jgi:hypothetical protein
MNAVGMGHELRIALSAPVPYVELQVTSYAAPVEARALDRIGQVLRVAQQTLGRREREWLRLEAPPGTSISAVHARARQDEAFLHRFCYSRTGPAVLRGVSYDMAGGAIATHVEAGGWIDVPGRAVRSVTISAGRAGFCIVQVCVTIGLSAPSVIEQQEVLRHLIDEMAVWDTQGQILPPWSDLRLRITTTVEVDALSPLSSSFSGPRTLTQCAYFRTQGPPALARYSLPEGHPLPTTPPAGGTSAPAFSSGLEDLTVYAQQTVPPTVPRTGDKPRLPRPVYRSYDVGVLFNETYVDQLYAAVNRDLTLYLFDNNDRPA